MTVSRLRTSLIAASATCLGLAMTTVVATNAQAVSTVCNDKPGSLPGVTLSVTDSNDHVVSADGAGYMVCVFPNAAAPNLPTGYSFVIGLDDRGGLTSTEDMGAVNLDNTFTVHFTLPEGQTAISAELYSRVNSYVIGPNGRDVTLVLQPAGYTSGTDGDAPEPLQDTLAGITGGIRVNSGSGSNGIPGMWIGSTVNRYSVSLAGSCPNFNTGAPSGSSTDGSIAVRLWAPHLTAGTFAPVRTNSGWLRVYIPAQVARACFDPDNPLFNLGGDLVLNHRIQLQRSEPSEGTTTVSDAAWILQLNDDGAIILTVPEVTFSSPTYRITATKKTPIKPVIPAKPVVPAKAKVSGKRSGKKISVKVTIAQAPAGKSIAVAETYRHKTKKLASRKARVGVNVFKMKVKGKPRKAIIKVTLGGKAIGSLKL